MATKLNRRALLALPMAALGTKRSGAVAMRPAYYWTDRDRAHFEMTFVHGFGRCTLAAAPVITALLALPDP